VKVQVIVNCFLELSPSYHCNAMVSTCNQTSLTHAETSSHYLC